jgi:Cobalamin biosynthesis protein CobT VWA domain
VRSSRYEGTAGISSGDFRVFKKRIEGIKTETAVQIVVDRSGSMSGAPIVVAPEACFATALAMQSMPGVVVAVSAFPGGGGTSIIRLSDFGQRVERQSAGFESLSASRGTPMVEAMLWGAGQLLSQVKPRRLLLELTDGGYDGPSGKNMVERLTRNGIECAGVGIGCDVAHLFDLYRVIADVRDLPKPCSRCFSKRSSGNTCTDTESCSFLDGLLARIFFGQRNRYWVRSPRAIENCLSAASSITCVRRTYRRPLYPCRGIRVSARKYCFCCKAAFNV